MLLQPLSLELSGVFREGFLEGVAFEPTPEVAAGVNQVHEERRKKSTFILLQDIYEVTG